MLVLMISVLESLLSKEARSLELEKNSWNTKQVFRWPMRTLISVYIRAWIQARTCSAETVFTVAWLIDFSLLTANSARGGLSGVDY